MPFPLDEQLALACRAADAGFPVVVVAAGMSSRDALMYTAHLVAGTAHPTVLAQMKPHEMRANSAKVADWVESLPESMNFLGDDCGGHTVTQLARAVSRDMGHQLVVFLHETVEPEEPPANVILN